MLKRQGVLGSNPGPCTFKARVLPLSRGTRRSGSSQSNHAVATDPWSLTLVPQKGSLCVRQLMEKPTLPSTGHESATGEAWEVKVPVTGRGAETKGSGLGVSIRGLHRVEDKKPGGREAGSKRQGPGNLECENRLCCAHMWASPGKEQTLVAHPTV